MTQATTSAIVVASPYMSGGQVSNVAPIPACLPADARTCCFSLYTGRQISTLTGMVRLYKRSFLQQALREEPVGEINSWILVHALHDHVPVVEVPARLAWPVSRRQGASRVPLRKLLRGTFAVLNTIRSLNARRSGRVGVQATNALKMR